jgi:cobalt-zinc-cadmium efflux system outer membrane protein
LTLAELEGMALGNHPALREATAQVNAARGRWLQVGLYPNPVGGYQANEIGNDDQAGQQGAYFSQEFVMGGKLKLNRAAANQAVVEAQQRLEAQRYRVLNEVRIRFYQVLLAQRGVELVDQLLASERATLVAVQQSRKAGEFSDREVITSQVAISMGQIQLENARNRHAAAWRQLAAAIAMPDLCPTCLAGDPETMCRDFCWDTSLARLLSESPELNEARAGVSRAEWQLQRARAEPIPNVEVQLGTAYDNASRDTITNVQVGLPFPLFNRNQGGVREAEANLIAAQAQVRRIELELNKRLAVAFERYLNARHQTLRYSRDILPQYNKYRSLVNQAIEQKQFSPVDRYWIERIYLQTELARLDAYRELAESQVALEGLLLTPADGPPPPAFDSRFMVLTPGVAGGGSE